MDITHKVVEDALWVECFAGYELAAYVKFIVDDVNIVSASTFVMPSYRGAKLATQLYMYAHNLGYKIQPSSMQSDAGKLMWKAFRKANLPFVQPTRWERFINKINWFRQALPPSKEVLTSNGG